MFTLVIGHLITMINVFMQMGRLIHGLPVYHPGMKQPSSYSAACDKAFYFLVSDSSSENFTLPTLLTNHSCFNYI